MTKESTLRLLIAVAWLLGCWISFPLWHAHRNFPLVPFVDFPFLAEASKAMLWGCALLLIMSVTVQWRWARYGFLILWIMLWLQDQQRWQPWAYQYSLMLLPCLIGGKKIDDWKSHCQWVVLMTYVWSALHKFNLHFPSQIAGALLSYNAFQLPHASIAYLFPLAELLGALALALNRFRKAGVWLITAMHLLLLGCLGPWGISHNAVVWPWNLFMIVFAWLLFYHTPLTSLKKTWASYPMVRVVGIIVLGVLPALNYVGRWDDYLSFSIYTGKADRFYLVMDEQKVDRLPEDIRVHCIALDKAPEKRALDLARWSWEALEVPLCPERRNAEAVAVEVKRRWLPEAELSLLHYQRSTFGGRQRVWPIP